MSQTTVSHESGPTNAAPPRYRGLRGAVLAGLAAAAAVALVGVAAAATLLLLGAPRQVVVQFGLVRFAWLALATGGATIAIRLIQRTQSDRLLSVRPAKGELVGGLGMIAGMFLAGYLAPQMQATPAADSPRQPALGEMIELSGPTLEGGDYDLARERGKVVLIDFWATWCGPCVGELPNVRAAYDAYHEHGFEVVAVSLDNDPGDLTKFLADKPEPWPQIIFPEQTDRGFDNPLAKRFGVQSIPQLLVVDRDGKLAARGVRGRRIELAVAETLGVPLPWTRRVAAWPGKAMSLLLSAVLFSPAWLLIVCIVGGAAAAAFAERAIRRALDRPGPNATLGGHPTASV